jgi:hypothetical protein
VSNDLVRQMEAALERIPQKGPIAFYARADNPLLTDLAESLGAKPTDLLWVAEPPGECRIATREEVERHPVYGSMLQLLKDTP